MGCGGGGGRWSHAPERATEVAVAISATTYDGDFIPALTLQKALYVLGRQDTPIGGVIGPATLSEFDAWLATVSDEPAANWYQVASDNSGVRLKTTGNLAGFEENARRYDALNIHYTASTDSSVEKPHIDMVISPEEAYPPPWYAKVPAWAWLILGTGAVALVLGSGKRR
jgi:hypothetical protein